MLPLLGRTRRPAHVHLVVLITIPAQCRDFFAQLCRGATVV